MSEVTMVEMDRLTLIETLKDARTYFMDIHETDYALAINEAMQAVRFPPVDVSPRRIMACVFACENIPTDALENGLVFIALDRASRVMDGLAAGKYDKIAEDDLDNVLAALRGEV